MMPNFAPLKRPTRSLEEALDWLTKNGCQITRGTCTLITCGQCTAEIEADKESATRIAAFPALLIGGERAELVDRGYQKFFKTSKVEVAATAENLTALHTFSELLKEALGYTSLYNEGLGSVSGSYRYDRVVNRDLAEDARPPRPWQK